MKKWTCHSSPGMEELVEGLVQLVALGIGVGLGIEVTEHTDVVVDVVGLTSSDSPEQAFAGFQIGSQKVCGVAHLTTHLVQYFTEFLQRLNFFFHCLLIYIKITPEGLIIHDSINIGTTYRRYCGVPGNDELYTVNKTNTISFNGLMSNLLCQFDNYE